jgi:glycerophosphoryl diester phosphodiesterase
LKGANLKPTGEGLTSNLAQRPLNIGHRGASGDAPENTLAAFALALEMGADGIEFDVHLSRDRIPMVIHDSRLERTTSGSGRVGEHTAATLSKLDAGSWFNRRFPALAQAQFERCTVPHLDEVLEFVRTRHCLAFLEIKQARKTYPGIEEKVLEQICRARVEQLVTVISFHFPTLARVRHMNSKVAIGIDFARPILALKHAKRISAGTLLPHGKLVTRRLVARAHQAGLRIVSWGFDESPQLQRGISKGVDGMITSYPARVRSILDAAD